MALTREKPIIPAVGISVFNKYRSELRLIKVAESVLGSNIKIKAVSGLDGTGAIVAADPRNLFYGTDMQGDSEKFDFWYSKDNQEFRLAIEFGLGVQVAFPNEVVISQIGA